MKTYQNLQKLTEQIRSHSMRISGATNSFLERNLAVAEIIAALYGKVLNISLENVDESNRDRFVLNKKYFSAGHAAQEIVGVEVLLCSLGHGLPIAIGTALYAKLNESLAKVYALISGGECLDGSTWEAAMLAAKQQLNNLVVIVDYNKIQTPDYTKEFINLEPFAEKWRSFGWVVHEVNGHDIEALLKTFAKVPFEKEKPNCIIAHTASFADMVPQKQYPLGVPFDL
jgi:transketolase